jgi:tetratricopeptide (TPR) repeat protein
MEAQEALSRAKGLISDAEFHQLISEGLEALHNNDYQLARAKLLKGKSFNPKSREVQDALAQVDLAMRLSRIDELRTEAMKAENSEQWEQALRTYLEVLKIDKNVRFAAHGKERAAKHIRIAKRIDFFLRKPSALESTRQLENAILLLQEIREIEPKGPRLETQFAKLAQLVEAAQTPVEITIESDNLTEVVIYKVGKLGRFAVRELNLLPGSYTLVGARDGYQDVRQKIVIKPGQEPLRIAVECEVKI